MMVSRIDLSVYSRPVAALVIARAHVPYGPPFCHVYFYAHPPPGIENKRRSTLLVAIAGSSALWLGHWLCRRVWVFETVSRTAPWPSLSFPCPRLAPVMFGVPSARRRRASASDPCARARGGTCTSVCVCVRARIHTCLTLVEEKESARAKK